MNQKVAPIGLRPEDRLPFVTARRHMLAPPRNAPPVMLVPYLLPSTPQPECQARVVNCCDVTRMAPHLFAGGDSEGGKR